MPNRDIPRVLAIALAVTACVLKARASPAQAGLRFAPQIIRLNPTANRFDQIVLGEDQDLVQARLEGLLSKRLAALDRLYHLSQTQRQKLELAGQGDISRLFERINASRKKFAAGPQVNKVGNAIFYKFEGGELGELRAIVESGPFGEDSLVAKSQTTILTRAQIDTEERRRQRAANSAKKITLENVSALQTAGRFRLDAYRVAWRPNREEVGLFAPNKPLEIRSALDFRLLRTLGKERKITAFEFSPQGDSAVIADNSSTARLHILSTGNDIPLATGAEQPAVAFSPDGKLLATTGAGNRIILWSAESGKRLAQFEVGAESDELTPVFSPDGKMLAVGTRNSGTRLFVVTKPRLLGVLPGDRAQELRFDPSGTRLAIAFADGSVMVWNVASRNLLGLRWGHGDELVSLDWSPDGKIIATSGIRAPVTLWRAADLKILREIEGPPAITCVRFNPEGTRLVYTGGIDWPGAEWCVEVLSVP